jgi:putative aldouronate transport system permease protein
MINWFLTNRWQQIFYITLPGIRTTIVILLILSVGNIMNVGFEKILLMYNPSTYEVSDVISTYVYRRRILAGDYSYGAAVGLFNSTINFILLITVNYISRKVNETSWCLIIHSYGRPIIIRYVIQQ